MLRKRMQYNTSDGRRFAAVGGFPARLRQQGGELFRPADADHDRYDADPASMGG